MTGVHGAEVEREDGVRVLQTTPVVVGAIAGTRGGVLLSESEPGARSWTMRW